MCIIDILDVMDCQDCESYKYHPGRTWGDPEHCYPPEIECMKGVYNGKRPCELLLDTLHDMILKGDIETQDGFIIDSDSAKQIQQETKGNIGYDVEPWFYSFDFSSASYFYIPDDMDRNKVVQFANIKEVYYAVI